MSYVILQTDKGSTTPDDVRGPYDTRQDAAEDLHYLRDAELHLRKGVTYHSDGSRWRNETLQRLRSGSR